MLFHCRFSKTVSVVLHTVTELHLPDSIEALWFKLSHLCAYVNVKNSRAAGWCCCTKQLLECQSKQPWTFVRVITFSSSFPVTELNDFITNLNDISDLKNTLLVFVPGDLLKFSIAFPQVSVLCVPDTLNKSPLPCSFLGRCCVSL